MSDAELTRSTQVPSLASALLLFPDFLCNINVVLGHNREHIMLRSVSLFKTEWQTPPFQPTSGVTLHPNDHNKIRTSTTNEFGCSNASTLFASLSPPNCETSHCFISEHIHTSRLESLPLLCPHTVCSSTRNVRSQHSETYTIDPSP